jgi:hypothetical protein
MKRIMTISITLAFIVVSGLGTMATAATTNQEQVQKSTLISQRSDDCRGDRNDPCTEQKK